MVLLNQIRQNYLKEEDEWNLQYFRDEVHSIIVYIEEYRFFKKLLHYEVLIFDNDELKKNEKKVFHQVQEGIISKDTMGIEIYFAYMINDN